MNEQSFYESIGRKQAALDALNAEYDNLLGVLARVASGEIPPQAVCVDLAARAWKLRAVAAQTVPDVATESTPAELKIAE